MIADLEPLQTNSYLDFMNVMTYDYHGHWEDATAHNSPMFPSAFDSGSHIYHNVVRRTKTTHSLAYL